jgi:hypothetical protein
MTTGIQHLGGPAMRRTSPSRDRHPSPPRQASHEAGHHDPQAQPNRTGQAGLVPRARQGAMTETTIRTRAGITARIFMWVRRCQRELSARVHAAGDERARQHGWTITETTGLFGFSGRRYRDTRFDAERRRLCAERLSVVGSEDVQEG